jgi:hypothetical protein
LFRHVKNVVQHFNVFQNHFLSKHKHHDDSNIKPQIKVAEGPVWVADDQLPEDGPGCQVESSVEEPAIDDHFADDSDDSVPDEEEEEELYTQDSFNFLK